MVSHSWTFTHSSPCFISMTSRAPASRLPLIVVLVEAHLVLVAGDFDHDALRGRFRISVCRHERHALVADTVVPSAP